MKQRENEAEKQRVNEAEKDTRHHGKGFCNRVKKIFCPSFVLHLPITNTRIEGIPFIF